MDQAPRSLDEMGFLDAMSMLMLRWRLVLGIPTIIVVVTALVLLFLVPPTFTARVTFVPEESDQPRLPMGLASIAGQFGVSLGSEASESPQFYSALVHSRELLTRVLETRFPDPRDGAAPGDSARLLDVIKARGKQPADSLESGVRRLRKLLTASVDNPTNVVELEVDARYPDLAAAVANRVVEFVNQFNTRQRQSQARERRVFVADRLEQAAEELRAAEEGLRRFYERNRLWEQSPELQFEEGRLRRRVDLRQELYTTLNREYEAARIEEVNDTPRITIIDSAIPPRKRSKPRRKVFLALAGAFGLVIGVGAAFGSEHLDRLRQSGDGEYRRLREATDTMRQELGQALTGPLRRK